MNITRRYCRLWQFSPSFARVASVADGVGSTMWSSLMELLSMMSIKRRSALPPSNSHRWNLNWWSWCKSHQICRYS